MAVPVDRMLTCISEGSGDLLCTGTSDTPARRAQAAFSRPIYIDGVAVMVRRKDAIQQLDQLKGKKVTLIRTSTASGIAADYLKKSSAGWKIDEVLNADSALSQIQLGLWACVRGSVLLALQRAVLGAKK
jgi:ABC-type amino acid transport substrate-binding protein